mmetsp:Transcript_11090/g.33719  ORF Transcript_11090/g.33719 Transcript_11090/m.33719 type:complete len:188 (-) Transcript_11090:745-1308(-)
MAGRGLGVGVVGAGAVGGLLAARLSRSGAVGAVSLVSAWEGLRWALKERGGRIRVVPSVQSAGAGACEAYESEEIGFLRAGEAASSAPALDALVFCVKAHGAARAARDCVATLGASGVPPVCISLQNGLGAAEAIAEALAEEKVKAKVYSGVVTHGVRLVQPGVVCHAGVGDIFLEVKWGEEKHLYS